MKDIIKDLEDFFGEIEAGYLLLNDLKNELNLKGVKRADLYEINGKIVPLYYAWNNKNCLVFQILESDIYSDSKIWTIRRMSYHYVSHLHVGRPKLL